MSLYIMIQEGMQLKIIPKSGKYKGGDSTYADGNKRLSGGFGAKIGK